MGLSRKLAQYITNVTYESLPDEVVAFTKLCILDYFGSAIAGVDKPPIQKIDQMVKELGGKEQATLMTGGKSSVVHAALVNGASSHMVELDDIHKSSIIHAATVVIPAALAVTEWKELTGKDLITSIVVGYEVCYRIGEAVSPSHYYYWHNTATCGTFGAAVAASKLLKLSEEQIIYALGSAGTQAAGLWEFIEDGAMSKQLHPGKAAMNGIFSALLSKKNFTGAEQILEGRRGFFQAMSDEYDENKITFQLGETFKIMENSFKIHASCRHTHHVMDILVLLLKEESLQSADIKKVTVKTYQVAIDITDNPDPNSIYAAKFSIQFCTALALLTGNGNLENFNEETLWDKDIRALMRRIYVHKDEAIHATYPEKWGAAVEIMLQNGETITRETDYPKGDPENPVTEQELVNKFIHLTSALSNAQQQQIIEGIKQLETLSSVTHLMEYRTTT